MKRDIVVVPPPEQTQQTFIGQVPRRRELQNKSQSVMERNLRSKGYNLQDFEELRIDELEHGSG